jgi:prevent-host-death family protein
MEQTSYLTRKRQEAWVKSWPVQDAKARFSELLDTCLHEGPQLITRRGTEAAVLLPLQDWHRLQRAAKPSLKALLLSDAGRGDLIMPTRGRMRRRGLAALA